MVYSNNGNFTFTDVTSSVGTVAQQVEGNTGAWGMQNDQTLHFGLGADCCDMVDLEIDWANGYARLRLRQVAALLTSPSR